MDGSGVEYEVIGLDADVTAFDVLPNGGRLRSSPGTRAQPGERLCHAGAATGQACGRVDSVEKGWFVLTGAAAGERDVGGPVYALSGDDGAVMVGLFEGTGESPAKVESWRAVMAQLYVDVPLPGPQPSAVMRMTTR